MRWRFFWIGAAGALLACSGDGNHAQQDTGVECSLDGDCRTAERCVSGVCVAEQLVCQPSRPNGVCPEAQQCVDGKCFDETELCAASNPDGVCPTGNHCIAGSCVSESLICSESNPTGLCPAGWRCTGGQCREGNGGAGGVSSGGDSGSGGAAAGGGTAGSSGRGGAGGANGGVAGAAGGALGSAGTGGATVGGASGAGTGGASTGGVGTGGGAGSGGEVATGGSGANSAGGAGGTSAVGGMGGIGAGGSAGAGTAGATSGGTGGVGGATSGGTGGVAGATSGGTGGTAGATTGGTGGTAGATTGGTGGQAGSAGTAGSSGAGGASAGAGGATGSAGSAGAAGTGGTTSAACPAVADGAPHAELSLTAVTASAAVLDANGAWDLETPAADLMVRWDFDDDGVWDTSYATTRVLSHDFGGPGTYTVAVEVQDSAGQTASATQSVVLGTPTYVTGTVNTSTWSGTVIVQGDVTVPAGETLTVAPGTQVLFVYVPNSSNDGTLGLSVAGTLVSNGTADQPVLFSVFGLAQRAARAWKGIYVSGAASLAYTRVEYAIAGLDLCTSGATTVDDSLIQLNGIGVRNACTGRAGTTTLRSTALVNNSAEGAALQSGSASFQNSTVDHNGAAGIYAFGSQGSTGVSGSTIANNVGAGLQIERGTTSIIASRVTANGGDGLYCGGATVTQSTFDRNQGGIVLRGCGALTVDYSKLICNRREGVQVWLRGCSTASPTTLHYNDIYDNASVEAGYVQNLGYHVSTTTGGTRTSPVFTTPNGELIQGMSVSYSESTYGNGTGYVRKPNDQVIWSQTVSMSYAAWVDISGYATDGLYIDVVGGSDWPVYMSLGTIFFWRTQFPAQVTVLESPSGVDASSNYWATDTPFTFAETGMSLDTSNPLSAPAALGP